MFYLGYLFIKKRIFREKKFKLFKQNSSKSGHLSTNLTIDFSIESPVSKISLSYSFILAGALGALGRRFESCHPK